ncbi:MAG: hypothetical protein VB063_06785 [Bacteroides graminisolvens]|nr:hypothetical protein [Bacteroides graminisolvens]
MGQKKGQTGNPNGRPKGRPNKITKDLKTFVMDLLMDNQTRLAKDFACLDSLERLKIAEKFMSYVIPKQRAIDAHINFDELNDEQLDTVIHKLIENIPEDNENNDND